MLAGSSFSRSHQRNAEWSNHTASRSKTNMENCGLMLQISKGIAMTCFGRPALAVAVVLMLAPLSSEVRNAMAGAPSAGVELARGGKPAYTPCAWAKPGRTCYVAGGLSTAPGRRHR
jgi:hypothetical protein